MAIGSSEFRKRMRELQKREVKVGWFSGDKYPESNIPVAFVAYVNEHGGSRKLKNGRTLILPARAPMRTNMERNKKAIMDTLAKAVNYGMRTGEIDKGMNQFGMFTAGTVKDTIESGLPPRNAEATINGVLDPRTGERKGSSPAKENRKWGQGKGFDSPLVDTGHLMKTVMHKVDVK